VQGANDKIQKQGLPGADECYAYNDSEDEGMHLIWEKQNQQETDTNDSRIGIEVISFILFPNFYC